MDTQKVHLSVPLDLLSDVRQEMHRYQTSQSATIFILLREALEARRVSRDYQAWVRYQASEQARYLEVPTEVPTLVHDEGTPE